MLFLPTKCQPIPVPSLNVLPGQRASTPFFSVLSLAVFLYESLFHPKDFGTIFYDCIPSAFWFKNLLGGFIGCFLSAIIVLMISFILISTRRGKRSAFIISIFTRISAYPKISGESACSRLFSLFSKLYPPPCGTAQCRDRSAGGPKLPAVAGGPASISPLIPGRLQWASFLLSSHPPI